MVMSSFPAYFFLCNTGSDAPVRFRAVAVGWVSGSAEGSRNHFKASVKSCSSSGGHMRLTSKVSESLDSHIEIPNLTVLELVFTPSHFGIYESFWPSSKVWSAGKLEVGPVWLTAVLTNHLRGLCFSVGNYNSSILSDCFLALIYKHVYLCDAPIQFLVTKFSPQWWSSVCLGFQSSWSWSF